MNPGCGTCRFYAALAKECRKNAPTAVAASGPKGFSVLGIFPATSASNWCGEYREGAPTGREAREPAELSLTQGHA